MTIDVKDSSLRRWYYVYRSGGDSAVIKVKFRGNESLDKMLRRFKKKCENEGLVKEIKKAAVYEKPSEVRRRKMRKRARKISRAAIEGWE